MPAASSKSTKNSLSMKDTDGYKINTMQVTRQMIADKIAAYLHHQIELSALVDWAEEQVMNSDFESSESRDVAARLGLADVRAFGLTWDDCEQLLRKLGFNARIDIATA